ncbi:hypothetical protein ACA910_016603 [Epithemia clementina (nom. ined.)]
MYSDLLGAAVALSHISSFLPNLYASAAHENARRSHSAELFKKPHILIIIVDDLGSHDLGIHGTGIHTPNSNDLAYNGVYLDNYYVLPYCSPTRAALLSGKYPLHTGLHDIVLPRSAAGLPLKEETLADLLLRGGYHTNAIGKWHVGHSSWLQTPTFRGFDEFYGFYFGSEGYFSHDHNGAYDLRHDKRRNCGQGCSEVVDERDNYSTPIFAREAIRMMEQYAANTTKDEQRKRPLFQYLAFQAVHCPNEVPQEYIDIYENTTDWSDERKVYAGMLTAADEAIGDVVEAYKKAGLWEDTLVIFTTDNGGPTTYGCVTGASNYPKRGGKYTLWEGGTTGDGFLSGPALPKLGVPLGKGRFPHLFHVVDWLPTLAEWAGVVPRNLDELDGMSQVQSLKEGHATRNELFIGYVTRFSDNTWFGPCLRYKNWKVVQGDYAGPDEYDANASGTPQPMVGGQSNSSYLLYDLEKDPMESTNMAPDYPHVLEDMIYKLQLYQQSYVAPQINDASDCPFPGFTEYADFPPVWEPWCHNHPQPTEVTCDCAV